MDTLRISADTTSDPSTLGDLTREGGASTFIRLFTSRHVADLRLLLIIIIVLFVGGIPILIALHQVGNESLIGSPTLLTGIVVIALGAVARIYQMGSIRLGVIDLFSCDFREDDPEREAWGKVKALLNELNRRSFIVFNKPSPQKECLLSSVAMN